MAAGDVLRIACIGGGSTFIVTLIHGLVSRASRLMELGRPIELCLYDLDGGRMQLNADYAEIAARQTGLPLRARCFDDRHTAIRGANLVLFCPRLQEPARAVRELIETESLRMMPEHSVNVAVTSAAIWPYLRGLGRQMRQVAPDALFASLVNPADVLAGAFEKAFGIRSVGLCVEVRGLCAWLSYYLRVPEEAITLEYAGANHFGWVSRWSVRGFDDAAALFWRTVPPRMSEPDWLPHATWFVRLYRLCGYLRASPYHNWPVRRGWDEADHRQNQRWEATCLGGVNKREHRARAFQQALSRGRLIEETDPPAIHPEATSYWYPSSRHTIGDLVVGLAGGRAGPTPLQSRNGQTNPTLPSEGWVEVPTIIDAGQLQPQSVRLPPEWLFGQVRSVILQRAHLSDWLAGRDESGLAAALLAMPEDASLAELERLVGQLAEVRDAPGHDGA